MMRMLLNVVYGKNPSTKGENTKRTKGPVIIYCLGGGGDFGGESLDFEENKRGVSVVTENPKGGIPENFGRIQTKTQMLKIMHKIL